MKRLTSILLTLIAIHVSYAQGVPISEFYNSKFGSSKAQVINTMANKGYKPKTNNPESLIYEDVKFLSEEVSMLFKFVDDQLFEGIALFYPDLEAQLIGMYEDIADDISMKYGKGSSYESYDYPYEKNDGYQLSAIRLGKARFATYWGIDPDNTTSDKPNVIALEIEPKGYIALSYQDSKLVKKAIAQRNNEKMDEL